jgi:hypothetical protein
MEPVGGEFAALSETVAWCVVLTAATFRSRPNGNIERESNSNNDKHRSKNITQN